jgi:hypothetical protein
MAAKADEMAKKKVQRKNSDVLNEYFLKNSQNVTSIVILVMMNCTPTIQQKANSRDTIDEQWSAALEKL